MKKKIEPDLSTYRSLFPENRRRPIAIGMILFGGGLASWQVGTALPLAALLVIVGAFMWVGSAIDL